MTYHGQNTLSQYDVLGQGEFLGYCSADSITNPSQKLFSIYTPSWYQQGA